MVGASDDQTALTNLFSGKPGAGNNESNYAGSRTDIEPMMIMVMDMSMHGGMSMMVIVACRLLRDFRYGFASQTCLYQPAKEVGELSDVLVDACLLQ